MLGLFLNVELVASTAAKYLFFSFGHAGREDNLMVNKAVLSMSKVWLVLAFESIVASMSKVMVVREKGILTVLKGGTHSEDLMPYLTPPARVNLTVAFMLFAVLA